MAQVFNTVWLYANDFNGGGTWATYTLVVPRLDVAASIALSTYAPVVRADEIGGAAIGSRIIKYTFFESANLVVPVDLPQDWNQTSVFIDNCASITFGLQAKNAWGYAAAVVYEQ